MPLIQSLAAKAPHTTRILNNDYSFAIDRHGRYICDVPVDKHVDLLISAQTYKIVTADPEPTAAVAPAAPPPVDPRIAATRAAMATASAPSIKPTADGKFVVLASWPGVVKIATEDLSTLPPFIKSAADDGLEITVDNGKAAYTFIGRIGTETVFELAGGSTYTAYVEPVAPVPATPDDLTKLKGVGAATAKKLNDAGFTTFAQLAALDAMKIAALEEKIGAKGIADWVAQAKEPAKLQG